jgi:protein-S-isoprenylcysteine O-methyltransferase Ste14
MRVQSALLVIVAFASYREAASSKPKRVVATDKVPHNRPELLGHDDTLSLRGGGARDTTPMLEKKQLPKGQYSIGKALEFHKAMWLPVSLALNYHYDNFSHRSCLMAAIFGGYGINWVLKSHSFFDKNFYNDMAFIGGVSAVLINWVLLSIFFIFPYLAAKNTNPISPMEMMVSVLLFSLGTFLHYGADAQKHYTLKFRGPGLITDGFFSRIRSPSYFGENLIFAAYAIVAGFESRLVWAPVAYLLLGLAALGKKKEDSLSRYEGYGDWKKKTWF